MSDNQIKTYSPQEIFALGMASIKRKEREQNPVTLDFWKANPLYGFWVIILISIIVVWTLGIVGLI